MKHLHQFAQTTPPKPCLQEKLILLFVTVGGVGYAPVFPGTVGTVVAIPLSLGLNRLAADVSVLAASLVLVVAIFSAIGLAARAADLLRQKDPGIIVIDEVVGYLLGNFAAPMTLSALLASFLLLSLIHI